MRGIVVVASWLAGMLWTAAFHTYLHQVAIPLLPVASPAMRRRSSAARCSTTPSTSRIAGIVKAFSDGDWVEVDGNAGTVRRVERSQGHSVGLSAGQRGHLSIPLLLHGGWLPGVHPGGIR